MLEQNFAIDLDAIAADAARNIDPNTRFKRSPNALPHIKPGFVRVRVELGRSFAEIAAELFFSELCKCLQELGEGNLRESTVFLLSSGSKTSEAVLEVAKRLVKCELRSQLLSHKSVRVCFVVDDHETLDAAHSLLRRSVLRELVKHEAGHRPYDSITISW